MPITRFYQVFKIPISGFSKSVPGFTRLVTIFRLFPWDLNFKQLKVALWPLKPTKCLFFKGKREKNWILKVESGTLAYKTYRMILYRILKFLKYLKMTLWPIKLTECFCMEISSQRDLKIFLNSWKWHFTIKTY